MIDLSFGNQSDPRVARVRTRLYQTGQSGISGRYRMLSRLEDWAECREYDHHQWDWNGRSISTSPDAPPGFAVVGSAISVRDKRPIAPLRLTPRVIERFTGLLFSDERRPQVTVEGDEEADDFVTAILEQTNFWEAWSSARNFGGAVGSVLVTFVVNEGKFTFKANTARVVHEVVWRDKDAGVPAGVLIQYPVERLMEEVDEKTGRRTGRLVPQTFIYRRIIDEEWDLVFEEVQLQNGRIPEMKIDDLQSVRHGLGFFPGAWVRNLPGSDEGFDGKSDCDGAYDLFDSIDRLRSQGYAALLANADPTLVISRDPKLAKAGVPIAKGSDNAIDVGLQGSATYLEIGAAGIKAAFEEADSLKQEALDKVRCVFPDPETVAAQAQSGVAMRIVYAPTLEKAGEFRKSYGTGIQVVLEQCLRAARVYLDPSRYKGNARPVFALRPKVVEEDPDPKNPDVAPRTRLVPRTPGKGGMVALQWGPYFAPSPSDTQTSVQTVVAAKAGGLLDLETAVEKNAVNFGIKDTKALIRKIREETDARMQSLMGGDGGDQGPLLDSYEGGDSEQVQDEPPEGEPPAEG